MDTIEILQLGRVIAVIALVVIAAVLTTPPNKVPLALRGLAKLLRKDNMASTLSSDGAAKPSVPGWKKMLAFFLVIIAFILAKI